MTIFFLLAELEIKREISVGELSSFKSASFPIFGASLLAGVGFTMSIFVSDIAFNNPDLVNLAKLSIILSSMISGILGAIWLIKTISIQNTQT